MARNLSFLILLSLILNFYSSCNNRIPKVSGSENDTTQIIRTLIDSTISLPRLSDIDRLFKGNPFGSVIIVKDDSILKNKMPNLYKFKILSGDNICKLARHHKDSPDFPNYLIFEVRKTSDSTYDASVKNVKIENRDNCLMAINEGCSKYMSFIKQDGNLKSKISN